MPQNSDRINLDNIEELFNVNFNYKDDLLLLLDICSKKDVNNKMEGLAFTGKYINGLLSVLNRASEIKEAQNLLQIKKDLQDNVQSLVAKLNEIADMMGESESIRIKKKFTDMSENSFQNLKKLIVDLDTLKKYYNYLKRRSTN
jgi:hypothetical protein